MSSEPKAVGYELKVHGGITHRGITANPDRRLKEHKAKVGPSAKMKIVTRPLLRSKALQWERKQTRTRGYHPPRRRRGMTWVRPHKRNGRIVRGHYRRS